MPLARAALYAEGEDVHVSVWPGSPAWTADLARFIAREGRVFVIAASGVLRASDIGASFSAIFCRARVLGRLSHE